jgi:hypothetical protein
MRSGLYGEADQLRQTVNLVVDERREREADS